MPNRGPVVLSIDEVPTALGLEEYGREDEFGWVLLEAAAVGPA